ncbi:HAD family hydrolase [Paenibacillus sp. KQZ6P-2]|uniref:HAD family hydrolase n=1 Tax=Paenibacillus mangrovi TaxID=2931978 RepID=A0A9X1WU62_9BACL|nr:HAD family hydrolase [Paenibacillus mangrovi]MCJ8014661.1 HAD family hydrolase [Paenibacillus mangrovi]
MADDSWLADIKVIIFDMDGTLYQEDTFMERYIRHLLKGTEHEPDTEAAVMTAEAIRSGEHAFGLGHFYHLRDGLMLTWQGDRMAQGYLWDGTTVPVQGERYDFDSIHRADLLHIGDPWGIVAMLSHQYKLPDTKLSEAFDKVRQEMLLAPYHFEIHTGLMQAIEELDVDKRVLMTNTPLESGIEFLEYMQIRHAFDEVYFGAGKPSGLELYLASLLKQGYRAYEILSIGDNPWNDLHPVKRMGGRTCFISPYASRDTEVWDLRLTSLDELEQLLRAIRKQQMKEGMTDGTNSAEEHQQEVQR